MTNTVSDQASAISEKMLERYSNRIYEKTKNTPQKNAIMSKGIFAVAQRNESVVAMNPVFSDELKTEKAANQKQSGRCWIFAALNTFRRKMNARFNLKDFELSQSYIMFWDKLEKSNYFLESILKTLDEPLNGRLLSWLLTAPQQDGGQWDMLVALIRKYGIVPKQIMPETYQSSRSKDLNAVLDEKLRECAFRLRSLHKTADPAEDLRSVKEKMIGDIYTILAYSLGEPPRQFTFEYRDEKNNFHRDSDLTPQDFFTKYIGIHLEDYVSIINAPTEDKYFGKTYTVQYLGNVIGGQPIRYLNVEMETLKQLAVSQLQDQEPVWFGSDVVRYSDRKEGILDTELYDFTSTFGIPFALNKSERLDYMESRLTHAMVLTGVNLINGRPNRWKVENSWGEDSGYKGYFVMSDRWMDEYTYQVVINKKYLSKELRAALDQTPIELKPWDPMGSLALMR
ncbi:MULTISPECIES: aminopeptidase C [unclassified Sporolactobacillus]|uniref:aminopeptidase C n=1 Tax=unclassified Sporolactobacillus TaxID=2628533 RepID=UPI0023677BF2|nr:C1 family peptidase [Sporolactobacillus sp. CQH2019]MDD9150634.1 C1 family peptidase [Sporolactobacillus sp. CQH2019]